MQWGYTALDDATDAGKLKVVDYLTQQMEGQIMSALMQDNILPFSTNVVKIIISYAKKECKRQDFRA